MNCPVCNNSLKSISTAVPSSDRPITIDACVKGCGGLWFDNGELQYFDELAEACPKQLLRPIPHATVAVDMNKKRACPRCPAGSLEKLYADPALSLQVDSCPTCQGMWLDLGELKHLREEQAEAAKRNRIIQDFEQKAEKLGSREKGRIRAVLELLKFD